MKRKDSNARSAFTRRKFLVEGLEPRCMLAGNVNVFVSGGSLFIQGDGSDNAVIIQQEGNGVYSVTGLNFDTDLDLTGQGFAAGDTSINGVDSDGEAVLFSGVKNDINVNLGGGNDGLGIGNDVDTLNNMALDCFGIGFVPGDDGGTISAGDEISPKQVEGTFSVPRNLFVNLGDGNDFTAIDANVGSSNPNGSVKKGGIASINLGNGTNGAAFGNGSVANDLLILGGNGNDNACVEDVSVHDLIAVQLGDGDENDADVENFSAGHALVTTGRGNDQVRVANFDLSHELTVATGNGNDQVDVEDFGAQNVTIDTGAGNDGTGGEIFGLSPALSIDSPVTVAFADISKTLVMVTGSGNDFATINNVSAHDITLDTGSGDDGDELTPISIYNVNVKGNLTLVTGSGNDFAYMHSGEGQASNINGNVTVDMGAGNDNLEIVDQTIGKDLNVFLGNGTNNAGIGGGVGEGEEGVAEGTLLVKHNLNIFGGANTDTVGLFGLNVHNDLFASLGSGNDDLFTEEVTINGNAIIDAGSGGDHVTIQDATIGKTATLLMGAGDDDLTITGSNAHKLIARGGPGFDTFTNDLGITKNGKSGNADVQEFEELLPAV